jgi:hypothetical protein
MPPIGKPKGTGICPGKIDNLFSAILRGNPPGIW